MTNLPRFELTENPNVKSDFIIFRNQTRNKRVSTFSKNTKLSSKKIHKYRKHKNRKHKTKKYKKYKSLFNIF